jgi:hypothetical protein
MYFPFTPLAGPNTAFLSTSRLLRLKIGLSFPLLPSFLEISLLEQRPKWRPHSFPFARPFPFFFSFLSLRCLRIALPPVPDSSMASIRMAAVSLIPCTVDTMPKRAHRIQGLVSRLSMLVCSCATRQRSLFVSLSRTRMVLATSRMTTRA